MAIPAASTMDAAKTGETPETKAAPGAHAPTMHSNGAPREEDVARVVDCICNHPRHRELLYKTLVFCREERAEDEVEAFIEAQPERAQALQTPYTLVHALISNGALESRAFDEEGRLLDGEYCAQLRERGLDDDALDDIVERRTVIDTPAGLATSALLAPEQRIAACMNTVPKRRDAFLRVLGHCREPRSLDDINRLLADDPALAPSACSAGQRLHAVYFIDRLNEAGGLVWDGAWVTTEAGKRFLASV